MNLKSLSLLIILCITSSLILSYCGVNELLYHALNGAFWGITIGIFDSIN